MKRTAWLGGAAMMLVAFSCNPGLSLREALNNKRCSGQDLSCLPEYECDEVQHVCVPLGTGRQDAGSAGLGAAGSAGSAGSGSSGGAGGSGTGGDGMDTTSSDVPDAADASPNCTRLQLFLDRDGDGFGSDAVGPQTMCETAGWVDRGGDCLDTPTADNRAAQVNEGQTNYFSEGYPAPGQPGDVSFDYDCSGSEEADPSNRVDQRGRDCATAIASNCGLVSGLETTGRMGQGADDRCGSDTVVFCNPSMMTEECVPAPTSIDAFRCR